MKKLLAYFLLTGLLWGCQDVIKIDAPQAAQSINIYGRVTDTLGTRVTVSLTTGYFEEGEVPYINDAQVYLYENGSMVSQLTTQNDSGEYHSEYDGETGKSYEIEVIIPARYGLPETWRSQPETMGRIFKEDSMTTRYLDRTTNPQVFEEGQYGLLYFKEPTGKGDHYRFRRWLNDSLFTQEIFVWDDADIDGADFGNGLPAFSIYGPMEPGDSLALEMSSISSEYYDFLALVNEQVFQIGGPFDPPPSPIIGNIYNADTPKEYGFGYFAATAVNFAQTQVDP